MGDDGKIPANEPVSLKHLDTLINQPRGVFNCSEGINPFLQLRDGWRGNLVVYVT